VNVTFKTETRFDHHHCNPGCNIYLYIEIIWIKLHDIHINNVYGNKNSKQKGSQKKKSICNSPTS
jgi:hypothetical protein